MRKDCPAYREAIHRHTTSPRIFSKLVRSAIRKRWKGFQFDWEYRRKQVTMEWRSGPTQEEVTQLLMRYLSGSKLYITPTGQLAHKQQFGIWITIPEMEFRVLQKSADSI